MSEVRRPLGGSVQAAALSERRGERARECQPVREVVRFLHVPLYQHNSVRGTRAIFRCRENTKPHSQSAGGARISGMKTFRKKYTSPHVPPPTPRNRPCRTSVGLQHNNYSDHCPSPLLSLPLSPSPSPLMPPPTSDRNRRFRFPRRV